MGISPTKAVDPDDDPRSAWGSSPQDSPFCSHRSRGALFICTDCDGDPTACSLCAPRHTGHSLYAIDGLADVATALRRHLSELCNELVPVSDSVRPPTLQNSLEAKLTARIASAYAQLGAIPGDSAAGINRLSDAVSALDGDSDAAATAAALTSRLSVAADRITASLECELVALDATLEAVRRDFGAVRVAADALADDDAGLVQAHGGLVDRLWEGALERARAALASPPLSAAAVSAGALSCGPGFLPPEWSLSAAPALLLEPADLAVHHLALALPEGVEAGVGREACVAAGARIEVEVALAVGWPEGAVAGDGGWQLCADAWALATRALSVEAHLLRPPSLGDGGASTTGEGRHGGVPTAAGFKVALTPFLVESRLVSGSAFAILAVDVPPGAPAGSLVVVERVTVWGREVPVCGGVGVQHRRGGAAGPPAEPLTPPRQSPFAPALPAFLRVTRRRSPLVPPSDASLRGLAFMLAAAPCVSAAGRLYTPVPGMAELRVGPARSGGDASLLLLEHVGLSRFTTSAAFDEAGQALLLADVRGAQVVAIDPPRHDLRPPSDAPPAPADASSAGPEVTVRWRYATGSPDGSCAVAVLPRLGLAAVSALPADAVHLLRLADGVRVGVIAVEQPAGLAVDAETSTLYVSCRSASAEGAPLRAWRWRGSGGDARDATPATLGLGGAFVELPAAALAGAGRGSDRPIAVVPAPLRSWASHAHLVVADEMSGPRLRVLALPGHTLVHEEELPGDARIVGLAGDAVGSALVVCDHGSQALRILPWPLPNGARAIAREGGRGGTRHVCAQHMH